MAWTVVVCEPGKVLAAKELLAASGQRVFLPMLREHHRSKAADGVVRLNSIERPLFGPYLFLHEETEINWLQVRYVQRLLSGWIPDAVIDVFLERSDEYGVLVGRELPRVKNGRYTDFVANAGDPCNVSLSTQELIGVILDVSRVEKTGLVTVLVEMLGRACKLSVHYTSVQPKQRLPPSGMNRKARRMALQELA
jgi:hypothetical protein